MATFRSFREAFAMALPDAPRRGQSRPRIGAKSGRPLKGERDDDPATIEAKFQAALREIRYRRVTGVQP